MEKIKRVGIADSGKVFYAMETFLLTPEEGNA
jgi:hypothetical protein